MGIEYSKKVEVITQVGAPIKPLFFDDIEGLLKWDGAGTGTDWSLTKDNALSRHGDYSLRLKTRETTPAIDDYVRAQRVVSPRPQRYLRFLAYMALPTDQYRVKSTLEFYIELNGWTIRAKMINDNLFHKIGYWDKNGDVVWSPERKIRVDKGQWAETELVIDTKERKYVSLRVNQDIIFLTEDLQATYDANNVTSAINAYLRLDSMIAAQQHAVFDDILVEYTD